MTPAGEPAHELTHEVSAELMECRQRAHAAQMRANDVAEELARVRGAHAVAAQALNVVQGTLDVTSRDLQGLRVELSGVRRQRDDAIVEAQTLRAQLAEATNQLSHLRDELTRASSVIDQRDAELDDRAQPADRDLVTVAAPTPVTTSVMSTEPATDAAAGGGAAAVGTLVSPPLEKTVEPAVETMELDVETMVPTVETTALPIEDLDAADPWFRSSAQEFAGLKDAGEPDGDEPPTARPEPVVKSLDVLPEAAEAKAKASLFRRRR